VKHTPERLADILINPIFNRRASLSEADRTLFLNRTANFIAERDQEILEDFVDIRPILVIMALSCLVGVLATVVGYLFVTRVLL
jgi:hypothetical protein